MYKLKLKNIGLVIVILTLVILGLNYNKIFKTVELKAHQTGLIDLVRSIRNNIWNEYSTVNKIIYLERGGTINSKKTADTWMPFDELSCISNIEYKASFGFDITNLKNFIKCEVNESQNKVIFTIRIPESSVIAVETTPKYKTENSYFSSTTVGDCTEFYNEQKNIVKSKVDSLFNNDLSIRNKLIENYKYNIEKLILNNVNNMFEYEIVYEEPQRSNVSSWDNG